MRALVAGTALLLVLTGCSEPEAETTEGEPTPTVSADSTAVTTSETATEAPPYLPVPEGVSLTAQGSDLEVGDAAVVAWEPRRKVVGALRISVTRLERASIDALDAFRLDPTQRRSVPYYVRARVKNLGETDLAGVSVPLYLVDGRDTLIQATPFAATFKPCPSEPMPKPFRTGDRAEACLVYLVPEPGNLEAVSFRPTQEYDPITWTGVVHRPGQ